NRHLQQDIHTLLAGFVGAFTVPSALRFVFGIEAEVHQRVVTLARFHYHVAAATTIAAGRSSARHKLLTAESEAAVAAVTRLHSNDCLVDEHEELEKTGQRDAGATCRQDCQRYKQKEPRTRRGPRSYRNLRVGRLHRFHHDELAHLAAIH